MDARESGPVPSEKGGVNAGQRIMLLGGAQVMIIYLLLAVESPWSVLANRAASSWGGRLVLAALGWLVITVAMIAILSIAERRAKRRTGAATVVEEEND